MKKKIFLINFLFVLLFLVIFESFFGYWFKDNNFGFYMRKERNRITEFNSKFNDIKYNYIYKRNFYGFRGNEFNPKDVKIIFEGGSTGNQRFHPEELTIVGQLNASFKKDNLDIKIYNASTDGKSVRGYINDFKHWFSKIPELEPEYIIFYMGINDRYKIESIKKGNYDHGEQWDYKMGNNRLEKVEDYIKNNSFVLDKLKRIKNQYFPRNQLMYNTNIQELYENFKYVDYLEAKKKFAESKLNIDNSFTQDLEELKKIINMNNFKPIFVTQVLFDGVKDEKLFRMNELLKEFSTTNKYKFIALDEIINMSQNDFFDKLHTTPQGSKKIADKIYPLLKQNFFKK
jgi:lysophospholipase L1-like esterase